MTVRHTTTILRCLLALLALLACSTPVAAQARKQAKNQTRKTVIRRVNVGKTPYLLMDDVAAFYGFKKQAVKKEYTYYSRYSKFMLTVDSRSATLNNVKIVLAFAPTLSKYKSLLISQADYNYYLEPILRSHTLPRRHVKRIVIDAGHGGKDPGCKGGNVNEKQINLQIAQRLANTLIRKGYVVAMTRTTDVFLSLQQRVKLSAGFKPDLFISLHCNAAGTSVNGIEVYCATPQNTPASDAKTVSTKSCKANTYDKQNAYIAFHAQKRLIDTMKATDRGVKHKRYTVITDLPAPCILVEMGFLTNAKDRAMLVSPFKQQQLANALAYAVDAFKNASAPPQK